MGSSFEPGQPKRELRVAHVGDLHFWALPRLSDRLFSKRMLGTANLLLRRARKFQRTRGGELVKGITDANPDWALFSGDFTTTSLESEFLKAKSVLKPIITGMRGRVRAVPGNHDRYTAREFRTRMFERYMEAIMPEDNRVYGLSMGSGNFLLGLDCTADNGLGSWGHVTPDMLQTIERIWQAYSREISRMWILAHFPAEDPPGLVHGNRRGQLHGAAELLSVLSGVSAPMLWLHGHHHRRWCYRSPRVPRLTYLNAGAPLMRFSGQDADLGFLEITATEEEVSVALRRTIGGNWTCEPLQMPEQPGEVAVWQQ